MKKSKIYYFIFALSIFSCSKLDEISRNNNYTNMQTAVKLRLPDWCSTNLKKEIRTNPHGIKINPIGHEMTYNDNNSTIVAKSKIPSISFPANHSVITKSRKLLNFALKNLVLPYENSEFSTSNELNKSRVVFEDPNYSQYIKSINKLVPRENNVSTRTKLSYALDNNVIDFETFKLLCDFQKIQVPKNDLYIWVPHNIVLIIQSIIPKTSIHEDLRKKLKTFIDSLNDRCSFNTIKNNMLALSAILNLLPDDRNLHRSLNNHCIIKLKNWISDETQKIDDEENHLNQNEAFSDLEEEENIFNDVIDISDSEDGNDSEVEIL